MAHDLTPSETARLDRRWVRGFVTEAGGEGGHTAILARGLELPAVVGTGQLLTEVVSGDLIIVDGDQGVVIVRPTNESVARYRQELKRRSSRLVELAALRDLPAQTLDGTPSAVAGEHRVSPRIGGVRGAPGRRHRAVPHRVPVSECRRRSRPKRSIFRPIARWWRRWDSSAVVIRTLDLGADKMGHLPRIEDEHNPFLGLRSIRLSLRNVDSFRIAAARHPARQCLGATSRSCSR